MPAATTAATPKAPKRNAALLAQGLLPSEACRAGPVVRLLCPLHWVRRSLTLSRARRLCRLLGGSGRERAFRRPRGPWWSFRLAFWLLACSVRRRRRTETDTPFSPTATHNGNPTARQRQPAEYAASLAHICSHLLTVTRCDNEFLLHWGLREASDLQNTSSMLRLSWLQACLYGTLYRDTCCDACDTPTFLPATTAAAVAALLAETAGAARSSRSSGTTEALAAAVATGSSRSTRATVAAARTAEATLLAAVATAAVSAGAAATVVAVVTLTAKAALLTTVATALAAEGLLVVVAIAVVALSTGTVLLVVVLLPLVARRAVLARLTQGVLRLLLGLVLGAPLVDRVGALRLADVSRALIISPVKSMLLKTPASTSTVAFVTPPLHMTYRC